jgi:hypothetical protein
MFRNFPAPWPCWRLPAVRNCRRRHRRTRPRRPEGLPGRRKPVPPARSAPRSSRPSRPKSRCRPPSGTSCRAGPTTIPRRTFTAFVASCRSLERQAHWKPVCASARDLTDTTPPPCAPGSKARFQPWALVNPDGSRNGLITGYYEPILKGSRQRSKAYPNPVFGPPDDMIVVELAELYPELKHLRLRGRLEGRKLVPYYSRAEWARRKASAHQRPCSGSTTRSISSSCRSRARARSACRRQPRAPELRRPERPPLPLDRPLAGGSGRDESRAGLDAGHQGLGQGQPRSAWARCSTPTRAWSSSANCRSRAAARRARWACR